MLECSRTGVNVLVYSHTTVHVLDCSPTIMNMLDCPPTIIYTFIVFASGYISNDSNDILFYRNILDRSKFVFDIQNVGDMRSPVIQILVPVLQINCTLPYTLKKGKYLYIFHKLCIYRKIMHHCHLCHYMRQRIVTMLTVLFLQATVLC